MITRFLFILITLLFCSSSIVFGQTGIDYLMSMEQGRIDRGVDPEKIIMPDIHNQKMNYRPDSGKWFNLPSVLVPEEDLRLAISTEAKIPALIDRELTVTKNGKKYHRLFIHPESAKFYKDVIDKNIESYSTAFEASATSSSRTVLVRKITNPKVTFFAKLSLDVELGGVVRTIPMTEVSRSVGTSDYILRNQPRLNGSFEIMPEVSGIIPKGFNRGGQIIRLIPDSVTKNKSYLVPLFSLYAKKNGKTLLEELAQKSGLKPHEFVERSILKPFMDGWAQWAMDGPIVMEAHAQNVLFELDQDRIPTGKFVHRDMGGFNIDTESKNFMAKDKRLLINFKSLREEYHQAFSQEAKVQSLYTYFEGGFLYNIDKELLRIDPTYKKGSIYKTSRSYLVNSLMEKSGSSLHELGLSRDPEFSFVEKEARLSTVIKRAQTNKTLKLSVISNCKGSIFHSLNRLLTDN